MSAATNAAGDVLDVAAVRADHALVEQLAAGRITPTTLPASQRGTEAELVAMLAAWIADVRPEAHPLAASLRPRENR